jgi:hypothetical protein
MIVVAVTVATPHVESEFNFTRKLETINVIPSSVTGNGWKNIDTLYEQDVLEDALFQSFSRANSAYRDDSPDLNDDIDSPQSDEHTSDGTNGDVSLPETPSDEMEDEQSIDTPPDSVSLPGDESDVPPDEGGTDTNESSTEAEAETTVRSEPSGIFGFFRTMSKLMPFAQESVVELQTETTSVPESEVETIKSESTLDGGAPVSSTETVPEDVVPNVSEEVENVLPIDSSVTDPSDSMIEDSALNDMRTSEPIVLKNFGIPQLASGQFITNVQLRMSLGAQVVPRDGMPRLVIEYSLGDVWEETGTVILDSEVSNALNGGYFLFALPTVLNERTLADLMVRIRVEGELIEDDKLFIDAAWLEVDTEIFDKELLRERLLPEAFTGLALPTMHEVLSDTLDFTRGEDPIFVLRYESQRNAAIRFMRGLFGRDLAEIAGVTLVRKGVGVVNNAAPVIDMTSDGLWTIQLPHDVQENLEPGTYTIEITVDEGGRYFTDTLDFQWGLLALNPTKTEYELGETATIALAALSPSGNTLCDANLSLYIIDPAEFIYRAPVTQSGLCNGNNVIDVPDYTASFAPSIVGEYEMYLEHLGENGEVRAHSIDTFRVKELQALSIEREGQTRIYPRAPYSMSLTVRSTDGYQGTLIEPLPGDFAVLDTDGSVHGNDGGQEIRWELDIRPGESATVSYRYDAPDISPFLYSLGPARLSGEAMVVPVADGIPEGNVITEPIQGEPEIIEDEVTQPVEVPEENVIPTDSEPATEESPGEESTEPASTEASSEDIPTEEANPSVDQFEALTNEEPTVQASIVEEITPESTAAFAEHRAWQIASDATGSMIVFWTDGATIPSGWTCISCASTSTFYQRFPLGGATYGSTGGVATSTHTADGSVNSTLGAASSESGGTTGAALTTHSHSITPTIGVTTTLPAYRQLRVIQNNSAGNPASIPAGAILIFDGTLPSGWVRYAALDDRYPFGHNTIVSSSTNTHTHSVTGTTSAAAGTAVRNRTGGTQASPLPAPESHVHTLTATSTTANHEPPYIEVVFATTTGATSTPLSALALWSDTPPAGWLDRSSTSEKPFYNRYIKGGLTYGTTGGSDTHTHTNFSATTSSSTNNTTGRTGATGVASTHNHITDISNFSIASNTPPYVTVIIAKYFGLVPIYEQTAFRWYTNVNSTTVTDAWPTSTEDVLENEAIDASFTPLKNGDGIRLRLQLNVQNSTSTGEEFKLQYGTTTSVCTAVGAWTDVGSATSSAQWIGFNNPSPGDGATLSTSTLTGTDVLESYEEQNPTVVLPNEIGINKEGEWDFVLRQNNATPATNYCFRMIESDGTELFAYTQYPMLLTDDSPNAPTLDLPFNNEKVGTTTPRFEFSGSDPETDDLSYQIQIDDDYTFASVNIDRNTISNPTQFANLTTPADKDPYTNGETIRFSPTSALTNGTTYYWRVRAQDPNGSNAYGDWSTIYSLTVDTTVTVSTWFQTAEEQFDTDTLVGVDALATDRIELISGSTTGTTTSSQIDFLDGTTGNAWGSLSWTDDETVGDIKYRLQYLDESTQAWTFISDSILSGNSTGFDTSPVSLLGLDTDTYRLLRLVAVFTNSGGTPILYDWTVSFGYRIETVMQEALFPNEKTGTTTPTFIFTTTDPQNDDLVYEIQWSTSYDFAASTTRSSDTHLGFINTTNGGDTSPFASGNTIQFSIQSGDTLTNGTTYWWRVRARDPLGSNQYSLQTDPISFTVDTTVTVSTWFQTTQSQFATDVLSGTVSQSGGSVTVATSTGNSIMVYAEGNITTPRYREWNGTTWGTESSALNVGATINWIVTKSSPLENEYVTGTLGTDADVNVQVFKNGSWGDLLEVTASIASTAMRGFDIAYEQTSGDALVVYCDGDANPSYYVWNGTSWTSGGGIGLTGGNTCGWIKLISDPVSDEIIAVTRDTGGITYEARLERVFMGEFCYLGINAKYASEP